MTTDYLTTRNRNDRLRSELDHMPHQFNSQADAIEFGNRLAYIWSELPLLPCTEILEHFVVICPHPNPGQAGTVRYGVRS